MGTALWAWGPAVALMGLIVWSSHQPDAGLNGFRPTIAGVDKMGHLGVYALLSLSLLRALRRGPWRLSYRTALWTSLAGAALFGGSDELHQSMVPGRTADPFDLLADCLGAGLAVLLAGWRGWERSPPGLEPKT